MVDTYGNEDVNDYDEKETPAAARNINRLSDLEKEVLERISQINVDGVLRNNPRDVEVVRDKVVHRLIDDDRNFSRYYMSQIVKDMRYLSIRIGMPLKEEDTEQYVDLENDVAV